MQSVIDSGPVATIAELLVLWQQPSSRAMLPVAILSFDGELYRFRYVDGAAELDGFRPLLGLHDFDREYESDELFPLFRERVLDPARSDYQRVVDELDLDPAHATPWEQLIRTGGTSEGDTIQVTPFPRATETGWECVFLAAGLRYFQQKSVRTARGSTPIYTAAEFEDVLASLVPGDHLEVIPELGNDYNPSAQLLFHEEKVVAYLPDWLARLCAPWANGGNALVGKTIRVNEAGAGWHLRLMAVVSAEEPFAEVDTRLRDGEALKD